MCSATAASKLSLVKTKTADSSSDLANPIRKSDNNERILKLKNLKKLNFKKKTNSLVTGLKSKNNHDGLINKCGTEYDAAKMKNNLLRFNRL